MCLRGKAVRLPNILVSHRHESSVVSSQVFLDVRRLLHRPASMSCYTCNWFMWIVCSITVPSLSVIIRYMYHLLFHSFHLSSDTASTYYFPYLCLYLLSLPSFVPVLTFYPLVYKFFPWLCMTFALFMDYLCSLPF